MKFVIEKKKKKIKQIVYYNLNLFKDFIRLHIVIYNLILITTACKLTYINKIIIYLVK